MTKAFEQIGVGDRVWVSTGREPHHAIRAVVKVTPKQIVLEGLGERYSRENGRRVGDGVFRGITVATSEECAAWDTEQEGKQREAEARRAEREHKDALRLELCGLFGENFYVSESNDPDTPPWEVHAFLTEDGVRRLAEVLKDSAFTAARRPA